jgi:hypothetical protein
MLFRIRIGELDPSRARSAALLGHSVAGAALGITPVHPSFSFWRPPLDSIFDGLENAQVAEWALEVVSELVERAEQMDGWRGRRAAQTLRVARSAFAGEVPVEELEADVEDVDAMLVRASFRSSGQGARAMAAVAYAAKAVACAGGGGDRYSAPLPPNAQMDFFDDALFRRTSVGSFARMAANAVTEGASSQRVTAGRLAQRLVLADLLLDVL